MRTIPWKTTTALTACAGLALALSPAAAAAPPGPVSSVSVTAAAQSSSLLELGDRGPEVRQWQAAVNRLLLAGKVSGPVIAEDGIFGPGTRQATIDVQRYLGVTQDGVVGPVTRDGVAGVADSVAPTPAPVEQGDHRLLRVGSRGADVSEWQRIINVGIDLGRVDHPRIAQDGVFGPQTRRATQAVQAAAGVTRDGVVGPRTRHATGWLLEG